MQVFIQISTFGVAVWLHSRTRAYLYRVCASLPDAELCVKQLSEIANK